MDQPAQAEGMAVIQNVNAIACTSGPLFDRAIYRALAMPIFGCSCFHRKTCNDGDNAVSTLADVEVWKKHSVLKPLFSLILRWGACDHSCTLLGQAGGQQRRAETPADQEQEDGQPARLEQRPRVPAGDRYGLRHRVLRRLGRRRRAARALRAREDHQRPVRPALGRLQGERALVSILLSCCRSLYLCKREPPTCCRSLPALLVWCLQPCACRLCGRRICGHIWKGCPFMVSMMTQSAGQCAQMTKEHMVVLAPSRGPS